MANEDRPAFKPDIQTLSVRARRIVNLGNYQSFELAEEIVSQPDPNYSAKENLTNLRALVTRHVDEACDNLLAQLELAKENA